MKEGLIRNTYELIIKEIQTIIAISYLLMIGVGMLFNYKKYSRFNINIFEYADVFDFLIAPFQDIRIMIVSIMAITVFLVILWIDIVCKKRFPKIYSILNLGLEKKPWYRKLKGVIFSLLLLYVIFEAATGYANFVKNNLNIRPTVSVKLTDNEVIGGKLIGKTKEVLFILSDGKVKIFPVNSVVKEIEIK